MTFCKTFSQKPLLGCDKFWTFPDVRKSVYSFYGFTLADKDWLGQSFEHQVQ